MSYLIFGAQMEHAGRLAEEDVYWRCNSGGPSSRTCTQRLQASILGKHHGVTLCGRVTRLALDFG